jgi:mannonate dehydratase
VAEGGDLRPGEAPGHGAGLAEAAAREHPVPEPPAHGLWALLCNTDGSVRHP